MNPSSRPIRIFILLAMLLLAGCTGPGTPPSPAPTPTHPPVSPTPTLDPEAFSLSELDLAAHIAGGVAEVEQIIRDFNAALAQQETEHLLALLHTAQDPITEAGQAIQAYDRQYAQLAPENIPLISAIQEDLVQLATRLDQAVTAIDQGNILTADALSQLDLLPTAAGLTAKAQAWQAGVAHAIEERQKSFASIQPQLGVVANNRVEAFTQAHDFIDAFQQALADGEITLSELTNISQLAANAQASLYNTGDPQLFGFAQQITRAAHDAVGGDWPKARSGIAELQRTLPARPRASADSII